METISEPLARISSGDYKTSPTALMPAAGKLSEQRRQELARAAIREYAALLREVAAPAICPGCNNTGVAVDRWSNGYPCPECEPARRARDLQVASGLNDAERRVMLSSIDPTGGATDAMLMAARSFLIVPRRMLTLHGGSGNGKTLVLQAIVNECLASGRAAVYATFRDLAEWVRDAYRNKDESALRRVERIQSIPVLCIDEFDKVKETEWIVELETAIIDKRYRDGLAGLCGTVVAMNKPPSSLPDWIESRLLDGRNKVIGNDDPDVRPMLR